MFAPDGKSLPPSSLPARIAGLGSYLPARRVTSAELEEDLGLPPGWIERRTGVRERRYNTGEPVAFMAAAAIRQALAAADMDAGDVDAFIGASSGPQQLIPCTAALVQRELGAPEGRSVCFDLNATCVSFLLALQTAAHFVAAGVYHTVVIFSAEIASRSLDPCQKESYVLFGDAAAAAIITRNRPGETGALHLSRFETHSSGADHARFLGAGSLHHPNDPATTAGMNLFDMDGPAVFRQGARLIGPFLDGFFAALGWRPKTLDHVVPHQASSHALALLTTRLGFRDEQVVTNLRDRGNCIAASVPLALCEAVAAGRIERGQRLLLLGTGAGLTLGAIAVTY